VFAGKKVHVSYCSIFHFPPPVLYEYPIVGYYHYDDVKWDRLEYIQLGDSPNGGNAPVARLCRDDFTMPFLLSGLRIFRPKPIGETC